MTTISKRVTKRTVFFFFFFSYRPRRQWPFIVHCTTACPSFDINRSTPTNSDSPQCTSNWYFHFRIAKIRSKSPNRRRPLIRQRNFSLFPCALPMEIRPDKINKIVFFCVLDGVRSYGMLNPRCFPYEFEYCTPGTII